MKTVAYDGLAAVTADEVADALLELALTVARYSTYELATIPVVSGLRVERLTVMLGPTIHLSATTLQTADDVVIEDAPAVADALRQRAGSLSDPLAWLHATSDHHR